MPMMILPRIKTVYRKLGGRWFWLGFPTVFIMEARSVKLPGFFVLTKLSLSARVSQILFI